MDKIILSLRSLQWQRQVNCYTLVIIVTVLIIVVRQGRLIPSQIAVIIAIEIAAQNILVVQGRVLVVPSQIAAAAAIAMIAIEIAAQNIKTILRLNLLNIIATVLLIIVQQGRIRALPNHHHRPQTWDQPSEIKYIQLSEIASTASK